MIFTMQGCNLLFKTKPAKRSQRRWFAALALASLFCATSGSARALSAAEKSSCRSPEYRQFDFFLGDWDAFDFDNAGKVVARNRVHAILDGCVVLEDYEDAGGHHGESFSSYDAARKKWHQTWVTNRGEWLVIEGEMESGAMVLSGSDLTADGKTRLVRGTWKAVPGGVRETAVRSTDGGKNWTPWFDMVFRPHTAKPAK